MVSRDYIIEKIRSLPENRLEEIADFIDFVGTKKKKKPEAAPESREKGEAESLSQVIGICEGPSDLAGRHDKYIYGTR